MQIGRAKILLLGIALLLSGCSSYSSNFSCGDSKGANCMPMDKVDQMISSGEIELYHENLKRCKGGRCKANAKGQELKELKAAPLQENDIYFKEQK